MGLKVNGVNYEHFNNNVTTSSKIRYHMVLREGSEFYISYRTQVEDVRDDKWLKMWFGK